MQHLAIVWTQDAARNALVARIVDAQGRAWVAAIEHETVGFGSRIVATVVCRSAGFFLSTNSRASMEEAQQWCYESIERV